MSVFLLPAYLFVMAKPVMVLSATNLSPIQANTYAPVATEDKTTSSVYLNTTELGSVTLVDDPPTIESLLMYQASMRLRQICLPFIIVAGTFGNVVVVVIHCRLPRNQKSSMSVYFTTLAVSDTAVLWTGWFWMLQTLGITLSTEYHVQRDYIDFVMDALCRIRVWVSYTFGQASAWVLVSMTVHRALSVVWPHRTRKFLTKNNARKVVVFIVSLCAFSNAHTLYGHSLTPAAANGRKAVCFASFVSESYGQFFNLVWVWEDIVVSVLLPFACLLVTNSVLIRKVGQSLREAKETFAEGRTDQFGARSKKLSSMTATLIATSVAFLLLTSPLAAYMIVKRAFGRGRVRGGIRSVAANKLALSSGLMLWYTNLAINFYIYCLTGARYRTEFLRLFGRGGATDQASLRTDKTPS